MCNLYKTRKSAAEIGRLFAVVPDPAGNVGETIYPGTPGLVITDGRVRQMVWGFPLVMKGKNGQALKPKPVNNARTDKLDSSFWRPSFAARRCLIPVSEFAEAEGPKGARTRTWFSLPNQGTFAVAGIWRDSAEWGPVYSMVMTEACVHVAGIHDRMPVILYPDSYGAWLAEAPEEVLMLCRPYPGPMLVRHTDEPWVARRT